MKAERYSPPPEKYIRLEMTVHEAEIVLAWMKDLWKGHTLAPIKKALEEVLIP